MFLFFSNFITSIQSLKHFNILYIRYQGHSCPLIYKVHELVPCHCCLDVHNYISTLFGYIIAEKLHFQVFPINPLNNMYEILTITSWLDYVMSLYQVPTETDFQFFWYHVYKLNGHIHILTWMHRFMMLSAYMIRKRENLEINTNSIF